jgi:hypothetical protein
MAASAKTRNRARSPEWPDTTRHIKRASLSANCAHHGQLVVHSKRQTKVHIDVWRKTVAVTGRGGLCVYDTARTPLFLRVG